MAKQDERPGGRRLSARLGAYQAVVDDELVRLKENRVMARLRAHDHTLWKDEPTEITNRLGWLDIARSMRAKVPQLEAAAQAVRDDGYTHALLLGMGGSSLAPHVLRQAFGVKAGYLDLAVLDSTDPGAVLFWANRLDLRKTLFIVSTKSGGTVETLSFFKFFYNRVSEAVGRAQAGAHFVAITDPGSKLQDLANEYDFRVTLLNDPNIGGRYSALSYFGLFPAALIGVDLRRLLDCALAADGDRNGAQLGAMLGALARAGRDKLTLVASPQIAAFGDWVEQLIAESTGKEGQGILPVVGEPLGEPEVYGADRLFVSLNLDGDDTWEEALSRLQQAGFPAIQVRLRNVYDLGEQFFLWQIATATSGHILGINPFDQPNVESAKKLARQMVAEYTARGTLPTDQAAPLTAQTLHEFLAHAHPGDPITGAGRSYIALQAFVQPTAETDAALLALRTRLRDKSKLATTVGYGPRFLHSTGQLHKGDAGHGLYIQFTADDAQDLPIPDRAGAPASSISFGVLKMAQALGDKQALSNVNRQVIRFHLGKDTAGGLRQLLKTL